MPIVPDREDDRSTRFWTLLFLAIIGVIPLLAIVAVYMAFDPNDYKAQVIDQVRKATGRELVLGGPIRMKLALRPTVEVTDVSLSNMEGGARPHMLRVARVEATVGLFALLQKRIEIDRLTLDNPDILLEADTKGHANWRFTPQGAAPGAPPTAAPPTPGTPRPPSGFAVEIREVRIAQGQLTWRAPGAAPLVLPLTKLDLDAEQPTSPTAIQFQTAWNGTEVGVSGQLGSLAALQGLSQSAGPFRLAITAAGAKANLTGALANPVQSKAFQVKVDATAPDLAALQKLAGGVALPPLHDVALSVDIQDRGTGAPPEFRDLSLRLGATDLATFAPGLKLSRLELAAANPAESVKIDAQGTLGALPLVLGASIGTPLALLGPPFATGKPAGPLPVDIHLTGAGAAFSARGTIADPARRAGMDLAIAANVPDLKALGGDYPALRDLKFQARLQTGPQGPAAGIALRDLVLTHQSADLAGEATYRPSLRPAVAANLTSRRMDADAIRALFPKAQPAPTTPRGQEPRNERRVIPDTPLPFAFLRQMDADLQLRADEVISGGEHTRNLVLRFVTQNGQARLDPFTADLPAGKVTASLTVDASKPTPPVALVLRSPGLALKRVYNEMGREGDATGQVEIDLDLRGAGLTARAIAATATGHLGLAVVGGSVDNRILNLGLFGDLVRGINLGEVLGRGGASQLRCFAARVDAQNGNADVKTLLLDSSTMLVEGGGRLNLADESLALRMKVQPRLQGIGVVLPVRVGGNFASPRVTPDASGLLGAAGRTATGTAGAAADIAGSGANAVTGTLGLGNVAPSGAQDACATALAIARGGRAGAAPAAATEPHGTRPGQGQGVQGQGGQGGQGRGNRPSNPLQRLLQ